ncbi:Uncharacterized protein QTN25_005512 [Entamoeba marina]
MFRTLVVILLVATLSPVANGSPLDNKLVKKSIKEDRCNSELVGKRGGIANFMLKEPLALPSGEPAVLALEAPLKAVEETQRAFTLLLDILLYGPYGLPFNTPIISPVLTVLESFGVMTAYDTIEAYRLQLDTQLYAQISGMGPKGLTVARNLNLPHRVKLGSWKETNPGG